jgi:hypothetical protein
MDAVEFVKIRRRMLKQTCRVTDLYNDYINPEEVVFETEKWAKEHPVKMRQSEFLKMFPNPALDSNGIIAIQPCEVIADVCKDSNDNEITNCCTCRREFWLGEIE